MIPKLQLLSHYGVSGHKVIIGVSKQTVYNQYSRPVLFEVITQPLLAMQPIEWTAKPVLRVQLAGDWPPGDEGSEKYIRGLTVGVNYVDEQTLIPQSSYNMLMVPHVAGRGAVLRHYKSRCLPSLAEDGYSRWLEALADSGHIR